MPIRTALVCFNPRLPSPGGDAKQLAILIFLSCLSGSDEWPLDTVLRSSFLSCLSGSDESARYAGKSAQFLSCLSGSDDEKKPLKSKAQFLSCLSGSDV